MALRTSSLANLAVIASLLGLAASIGPVAAHAASWGGATIVAQQRGAIAEVEAGRGVVAWVRCAFFGRPSAPQEIWGRRGSAPRGRIVDLEDSDCLQTDLVGTAADELVVRYEPRPIGRYRSRSLIAVGLRDGVERFVDSDRSGLIFPPPVYLMGGAATAGPTLAWWRDRRGGTEQLMSTDLRGPPAPVVAAERQVGPDTSSVSGLWFNGRGDALLLESGFVTVGGGRQDAVRRERLVLRGADGAEQEVARLIGGRAIIGGELNDRWLTFTLGTESGRPTRIEAWRLAPLERVASWSFAQRRGRARELPGRSVGRLGGDALLWEREVSEGSGVRDGIRIARLPGRTARWLWSVRSRPGRGLWVTRPAVRGRSALVGVTGVSEGPDPFVERRPLGRVLAVPLPAQ